MARRAEWRRSPDDPGTPFAFLRRCPGEILRAQEISESIAMGFFGVIWVFALFIVAAIPMMGGAWMALRFGWFAGLLTLVAVLVLIFFLEGRAGSRPNRPSRAPMPLPATVRVYPVEVAIRYRGALTGVDKASAAFVEGWLYVEGSRTTFSLRWDDGRSAWHNERLRVDFSDDESLTLKSVVDSSLRTYEEAFREVASRWLRERENPTGEPVLPPLGTYWTMRRGWAAMTLIGVLMVFASLSGLPIVPGFARVLLFGIALLGGSVAGRGLFVLKRQNEADRRARTEREENGSLREIVGNRPPL